MDLLTVDKNSLKAAFSEMLLENRDFFKNIIREVINEKISNSSIDADSEMRYIDTLIDEDFKKYDAVFKALA